jgi:hypothetical protein
MPGIVFVLGEKNSDAELWFQDLRDACIGADIVVWVPRSECGGGLYRAILDSPVALAAIYEILQAGGQLELFCSSIAAEDMASELGARLSGIVGERGDHEFVFDPTRHLHNPSRDTSELWNDKLTSRVRAREAGKTTRRAYPRHVVCSSFGELQRAIRSVSSRRSYVVKLDPTAASTEQMIFCPKGTLPDMDQIRKGWSRGRGAIVERFMDHLPFSLTFDVREGVALFSFASLQKLKGIGAGRFITIDDMLDPSIGSHEGNFVGSYGQDLGRLSWSVIERSIEFVDPMLKLVIESGYQGSINIDMAWLGGCDMKKLEFNARTSNSSYAAAVQAAVQDRFSDKQAVVYLGNVEAVDDSVTSYADARRLLDEARLLYRDGRPGVQLYHTPLLEMGVGKCGIVVIAPDFDSATRLASRARAVLQARQLSLAFTGTE